LKKTNNIENLTDNEIIILYKKSKDKNLVGELYKRYTKFVFLISMKYLTDEDASKDAVMQIFEKLFEDLIKHEITNFKSWLHTVTRNHCFLILRTENYIQKKEEEIKKDSSIFMESFDDLNQTNELEQEITFQKLQVAINELNDEQKICVELFYLQNKSYNEIVESTGFDMKKVKSYIQNGKRNLKIILEKNGVNGLIIILLFMVLESVFNF